MRVQAVTPSRLGAHNLPDDVLVQIATAEDRVIVTENASDFAQVASSRSRGSRRWVAATSWRVARM